MGTATSSTPGAMKHLGMIYETPEELAATLRPHVLEALTDGHLVTALVDRRTARALREELGEGADYVGFSSPGDLGSPRPRGLVEYLRGEIRPGRHSVVLAQYCAVGLTDTELTLCEDSLPVELAELPLTLVCLCSANAREPVLAVMRRAHGHMIRDGSIRWNPAGTASNRSPSTPHWLGSHALHLEFRAPDDLARLRAHVASTATAAGLKSDNLRATVLAVHEAAVLACEAIADLDQTAADPGSLDAWIDDTAGHATLAVEVRWPQPSTATATATAATATATVARADRRRHDPSCTDDSLNYIRLYCPEVSIADRESARVVRLRTPAHTALLDRPI